tara:strand:- start:1173 stop:1700 length:528 start_codon:yes stop_codon:yes gene_type:complete
MNQQLSMFDESAVEKTHTKRFHDTKSIMKNGRMHSIIKYKKIDHHRHLDVGDKLDVYRNLNRSELYSAKAKSGEFKNLVSGYAKCYVLKDVSFFVGKGRETAVERKERSVHAFARGELVDAFDQHITELQGMRAITYNPFNEEIPYFHFKDTGEIVKGMTFKSAIVQGSNVWVNQ